jgi:hypothetical protein
LVVDKLTYQQPLLDTSYATESNDTAAFQWKRLQSKQYFRIETFPEQILTIVPYYSALIGRWIQYNAQEVCDISSFANPVLSSAIGTVGDDAAQA